MTRILLTAPAAAPLVFPAHYPPTDKWKKFFNGVRWLGPDLSFFKTLRAQQAARSADMMQVWGSASRQKLALHVGDIFSKHLRWSTPYFLPQDRVEVIATGPHLGLVLDCAEEAVEEIEVLLGKHMGDAFWNSFTGSFEELIDQLLLSIK
jgi:hypothetical protein